jgi:hypothetical protein
MLTSRFRKVADAADILQQFQIIYNSRLLCRGIFFIIKKADFSGNKGEKG